jgi:hypothetical protein
LPALKGKRFSSFIVVPALDLFRFPFAAAPLLCPGEHVLIASVLFYTPTVEAWMLSSFVLL